ncbi:Sat16, partial [Stachybotrys chartarum IBT 40293]
NDNATPRAHVLKLILVESRDIIRAVKTRLCPQYTISYLAQAATVIAMLDTYSSKSELSKPDFFVALTAVNGRRYLREDLESNYLAGYVTGAPIKIEKLRSLLVSLDDSKDIIVSALEKAAKDAKRRLDMWIYDQSQLATGFRIHSFKGAMSSENPELFIKTAVPYLSSYGINEV